MFCSSSSVLPETATRLLLIRLSCPVEKLVLIHAKVGIAGTEPAIAPEHDGRIDEQFWVFSPRLHSSLESANPDSRCYHVYRETVPTVS